MDKNIFESIKKENEFGQDYWSARELYKILEYSEYNKFLPVIEKAKIACKNSLQSEVEHFAHVSDPQKSHNQYGEIKGQILNDYKLSRYACYLIIQNANPRKEIVALGQTYFAIQTRKQEVNEQLLEDSKRKYLRDEMSQHNKSLAETADKAGVKLYGVFTNYGYMGLYNGLDAKGIHTKKQLKKSEKILDHMGSEELAANLFRATQAEAKLIRENILGEKKANQTHFEVGKEVRETIKKLGGTMPEELPTTDSIIKVEKKLKSEKNYLGEMKKMKIEKK
ncbi:MAG: DNA damage-inducible protein D [Candidatus Gracilibacteria bacterium]